MNETQLQYNLSVLEEIRNLKEGWWDGRIGRTDLTEGKQAFSNNLIDKVKGIILKLKIQPEIFPTGRNSIQVEFKINEDYIDFELFENGKIVKYFLNSGKKYTRFVSEKNILKINILK